MTDWWNGLTLVHQLFYGIGILALTATILQLLLTLIGFGGDGMGIDAEFDIADAGDHSSGIGIFSVQTLAAFFTAFGWVGVICLSSGVPVFLTILIAFICGVITMYAMYRMIRAMLKLQSKGNLRYDNAVGKTATVYVTIPGSNQDGGQIQVTIQDRLTTASARKEAHGEVKAGQKVKIIGMLDQTSFLVEDL